MIKLGRNSYNPTNDIDCYEGVNLVVGSFTSIGSGLKIYSGTHPCINHPHLVSQFPFKEQGFGDDYPESKKDGDVYIGHDVWIATDVRILEGVSVGNGAIIGAGSVVTKDVPDYAFVAGNPARVKKYRFPKPFINLLLKIQWWNWSEEQIKERLSDFQNVVGFVRKYG